MTQSWDLLIQGAKVFDGSGALPSIQDVAVRDGKIAARGDDLPAERRDEGSGWQPAVAGPGMLDIHTHLGSRSRRRARPTRGGAPWHHDGTGGNCSLGTSFGTQQSGSRSPSWIALPGSKTFPKPYCAKSPRRSPGITPATTWTTLTTCPRPEHCRLCAPFDAAW